MSDVTPIEPATAPAKLKKLTGQQENFAREYVRCGIGAEAYRRAYRVRPTSKPETTWRRASELLNNSAVAARISALFDQAAEVSRGEVLTSFRWARDGAMRTEDWSAVNGSARELGKLGKHYPDDRGFGGLAVNIQINLSSDDLEMM